MDFVAVSFPDCIAFGAQSDPMWSTNLSVSFGGFEVANQNWQDNRHMFDVSFSIRNATDYRLCRSHFNQMRGRAKAFPFKDFLDFEAAASEGVTADAASASDGYQLYKRYGSGDDKYDRKITRPVSGTLTIYRTRSAVTTNVTADCTINYGGDSTLEPGGTFSVTGDQEGDVYTWAGEFNVPCRYDTDRLPAAAVNKEPGTQGELLVSCGAIPVLEVKE
jgi:uncharacterized protein (TIGR02217 family)